jgi:hypothetical protein
MEKVILSLLLTVLSFQVFGNTELPECLSRSGQPLLETSLKSVMSANEFRPQAFITGKITQILAEDTKGSKHQKYIITAPGPIQISIVSNLSFGRVPLVLGATVSVCGEYMKIGAGMIHWTHFDPHGGHPNGFTIVNGVLYGETEITN